MTPRIIESYSDCGVNVGKIIRRIISFVQPEAIDGLSAIILLDRSQSGGLGFYQGKDHVIYLFVHEIVGWQPWIFKKTFIFPYLTIGFTLGHEIDHHVRRNQLVANPEETADQNAMVYIYPSMGIFKPIVRLLSVIARNTKRKTKKD